jgi:hypothetical protein
MGRFKGYQNEKLTDTGFFLGLSKYWILENALFNPGCSDIGYQSTSDTKVYPGGRVCKSVFASF